MHSSHNHQLIVFFIQLEKDQQLYVCMFAYPDLHMCISACLFVLVVACALLSQHVS